MTASEALVRMIVEECWSSDAGVARLSAYVAPDYVHHAIPGDWTFEQWKGGVAWIDGHFADRAYVVDHVVVDGDLAAAFIRWTATRRSDGSPVSGFGAYHCRIVDDVVAEDWDVFYPLP
jgi:hypothetical protein